MCKYKEMAKEMTKLVNAKTTITDAWRKVSKKYKLTCEQGEILANKYRTYRIIFVMNSL